MELPENIRDLHDATLIAISVDWADRKCALQFAGAPAHQRPFALSFSGFESLVVPTEHPWGPSVSVLRLSAGTDGRFEFEMQSGDTIVVRALAGQFSPGDVA